MPAHVAADGDQVTPAQTKALAVALDGLRESGLESADIAREVLRAVEPNHDNLLATRVAVVLRERISAELNQRYLRLGGSMTGPLLAFANAVDWVGRLNLVPLIESITGPFSPPDDATGVHAHRPEAPAARIPCERCRNLRGQCDCARGPTPHEEHTSPAEFCWCRTVGAISAPAPGHDTNRTG